MFASLILFLVTFVVAAHAATNPTATYSAVFNAGGVTGSFEVLYYIVSHTFV